MDSIHLVCLKSDVCPIKPSLLCGLLSFDSGQVNLRLLVYRYGMKNSGTETEWNQMFDMYQKATLAQEKDKLLYGLASVENVALLYR